MFKNIISVLKELNANLFFLSHDFRRLIESERKREVINNVVIKLPGKKRYVKRIIKKRIKL